jgi:alkanesulfonate monooxygenase SsuD/methylene tetrahydromethanopterin reductase-like flavin-dependent oxidoreductase (luciferase family)
MKMQPITTGIAAIRAQVRIFGRDSEPFTVALVVAMFIRPTNTAAVRRSTGLG